MSKPFPKDADLLEQLKEILGAEAPEGVMAAYVFGSIAEGRSHKESDIDLGVLLDRSLFLDAAARFKVGVRISAFLSDLLGDRSADVIVLNDAPPGLAGRIAREGRRVYCVDEEAAHAFVRDAQLRAADLEPFLRRMRKIKLKALARP
jgi:predicted nucleotidyltransferase